MVPLRSLLLWGTLGVAVLVAAVFALIIVTQTNIDLLVGDTRDNILPRVLAQNDISRDVERLLTFGEEALNAQDPAKRRLARISAQTLVYTQSFSHDEKAAELGKQALEVIVKITALRGEQSAIRRDALATLLRGEVALAGRVPPARQTLHDALLELVNASTEQAFDLARKKLAEQAALRNTASRETQAAIDALLALKQREIALDRQAVLLWEETTRRLKSLTDTFAAEAEIQTGTRFEEIRRQALNAKLIGLIALIFLSLLFLAIVLLARKIVVGPLLEATRILEKAPGTSPEETLPATHVAEIDSILRAAHALAENTQALEAERSKVIQLKLENAAQREKELQTLVAQRTEELEIARQRAETANQAKSAFLANMTHELRTPLNAVLGFTRLLLGTISAGRERNHLEIVQRSGEHLLQLINDVLDMSKIEAGHVGLKAEKFDLLQVLREVAEMVGVRAHEAGLSLTLDIACDMPRYVAADAAKLRQVLINLLGNAIKYTREGGVVLAVGGESGEGASYRLELEVKDSGIGIPQSELERIFQPFEQISPEEHKGTGLGLAITRQFVELMGGTVTVASQLGKGSTFHVELPVGVVEALDAEDTSTTASREFHLASGQPPCRVLVVDDNPENRALLAEQLGLAGFEAATGANGAEAIECFHTWRPHAIFMDNRMPVMGGIEATTRIKALEGGRDTVIFALSATVFDDQGERLRAAGCVEIIHKPYRPETIFTALEKYLGVTYRPEENPLPSTPPGKEVDPRKIPANLLEELRSAATICSYSAAKRLVASIGEHDAGVAAKIDDMIDAFAWDALQAWLNLYSSVDRLP